MSVTFFKLLMDPIDFHSTVSFYYYESQWGPSTFCFLTFIKISTFVFSRRKKFIEL